MRVIKKFLILGTILIFPFSININSVSGINYNNIEKNIEKLHKKNGENYLKNLIKIIEKIETKKNLNSSKKEILKNLKKIINKQLEKKFLSNNKVEKKIKAKKIIKKDIGVNQKINSFRKNFYNKYAKNIISKNPISKLCLKKYDLIDSIAKKNDFPVELIIATWGMEHSCIFANPANGNGNFQIITRFYKPGKITDKQFAIQVQDFINFSKNKWKFWEKYKKTKINLKYNNYDFNSIRYHAAAYNGIGNHLINSKYINGNLNPQVPYKKDGITTRFLKVLAWEIKNKTSGNTYGIKGLTFSSSKNQVKTTKAFGQISYSKIGKDSYKVYGTTNGKLKYIKVLWLNGGKNEKPYKLQTYYLGKNFFNYTIKPKYENIKSGINKYKFFGEDKTGKKFEKILVIKNQ